MSEHALTKSAVMIASSVWEPGNQIALMMKLPVASCGCNTRWSETEPVLLNVNTWQSWRREERGQQKHNIKLLFNTCNKTTFHSIKKKCLDQLCSGKTTPFLHSESTSRMGVRPLGRTQPSSLHYRGSQWDWGPWKGLELKPVESVSASSCWSRPV